MPPRYNIKPAISQALAVMREEKGMSREQVAVEMGVSATTVYRWENNTRTPDVNDLAALAQCYGTSVASFFPTEESIATARQVMEDS